MARLRKFVAYRKLERPYTRISKYKSKSYIKARPSVKISRFDMGNTKGKFEYRIYVKAKVSTQIRQEALESARQTANRVLESKCGKNMYKMKLLKFPHHILRENPLATGAGADRLSSGMKHSFGKTIGIAAQVFKGESIFYIETDKSNLNWALLAAKRISHKIPCKIITDVQKR